MASDLTELLERVKAATGPDRELDAVIWLRFTPGATRKTTRVRHKTGAEWDIDETRDATGYLIAVPNYTASLDAALALVERVKPGAYVELSGPRKYLNIPTPVPNRWCAQIVEQGHRGGWGSTAPLALLAALLGGLQSVGSSQLSGGTK